MTVATRTTGLTHADLVRLREEPEYEFLRLELIGGELVVSPGAAPKHQRTVSILDGTLGPFIRSRRLGEIYPAPVDVRFAEGDTFQPDLVFVARERLEIVGPTAIDGPPDLVVEILSPSTRRRDLGVKRERYARFGVREYWIVDHVAGTVEVLVLRGDRYEPLPIEGGVARSEVVPGFALTVADLF